METIISAQNRLIRQAGSLKQKKYRDELGLFIAEGVRLIEDAARSDWEIVRVFCTEKSLAQKRVQTLVTRLEGKNIDVYAVKEAIFRKMSETETPQGVLAIIRQRLYEKEDVLGGIPLVIALDGVQDPGNVGTILRTAEAASCSGAILISGSADLYSGKVVRSTMGSIFRLPVLKCTDQRDALAFAAARALTVVAVAFDETGRSYDAADFTRPLLLVFGSEAGGISEEILAGANEKIYLPMCGRVESLNVSSAAAVVLYEALRQRRRAAESF